MPEELAADGRCQSSITKALAVANDCRNVRNGAYSAESKKSRTACSSRSDGVTSMTRYALTALNLLFRCLQGLSPGP